MCASVSKLCMYATAHQVYVLVRTCMCNVFEVQLTLNIPFHQECLPDNAELSTKLSTSLKRISENFISPEVCTTYVPTYREYTCMHFSLGV